jgi:hypothetical protein
MPAIPVFTTGLGPARPTIRAFAPRPERTCMSARRVTGIHQPGTTTSNRGIKRSTGPQIVALVDTATPVGSRPPENRAREHRHDQWRDDRRIAALRLTTKIHCFRHPPE